MLIKIEKIFYTILNSNLINKNIEYKIAFD